MTTNQKPAGKNYRNEIKNIVIGPSGTGKSSFMNKWTKHIFNESYKPQFYLNLDLRYLTAMGYYIKFNFWK